MTSRELKEAFLKDLQELLKKYKAGIEVIDRYDDPDIEITFEGIYEGDNQRPYCYLKIGTDIQHYEDLLERYKKELDKR